MEALEEYLSPFTTELQEAPEDSDEAGSLTEQGKAKLQKVLQLIKIFQNYESVDRQLLEGYQRRQLDKFDLTEPEAQEKFKTILNNNGIDEEFKTESQYEEYPLNINLSKDEGKKLLEDLLTIRIPKVQRITIGYITKDSVESVRKLLDKSFPHRIGWLCFNFSGRPKSQDDLLDLSLFIDLLIEIGPLVSTEIEIWNCKVSADSLNKLVVHFSHVKKFWIHWSLFTFGDDTKLDFKLADSPNIEELSFEGCGDALLNNWGENLTKLRTIMEGFKNSDVKDKIKKVNLEDCGDIDDAKVEEIMNENGIKFNE